MMLPYMRVPEEGDVEEEEMQSLAQVLDGSAKSNVDVISSAPVTLNPGELTSPQQSDMSLKLHQALSLQPYALPAFLQEFEPIDDRYTSPTAGYANVPRNVHENMYE